MAPPRFDIPLDYEGIVKLVADNGLKLTPRGVCHEKPNVCVISAIAIANDYSSYLSFLIDISKHDQIVYDKLRGIEEGFEQSFSLEPSVYHELVLIGKKLRDSIPVG